MNENTLKNIIKFAMECSQDEMIFLDIKIVAIPIADKKVVITRDMYSKKLTLISISVQINVVLKIKTKIYLLEQLTDTRHTS